MKGHVSADESVVLNEESNGDSNGVKSPSDPSESLSFSLDEKIVRRVNAALESMRKDSVLFATTNNRSIPIYQWTDVEMGEELGEGGFGTVRKVTIVAAAGAGATTATATTTTASSTAPPTSLAIKFLKPSITEELTKVQGVVDLVSEAEFLSVLEHKNLVKLHGMSSMLDPTNPFLIMDALDDETLEDRLDVWKRQEAFASRRYRNKNSVQYLQHLRHHLKQRLASAMDVARVLQYLHSKNVVYRDLKPSNIGFDPVDGTLKLFDFGLAKELKNPTANGKYQMTGETGSWVYMAPEVAKRWAYDARVDIYSFGILLWEMCSLERAFEDQVQNGDDYKSLLQQGDVRPELDKSWPTELQWLMKKCWSYFAAHRPTWETILDTLQEIMDDDSTPTPPMSPSNSGRGFAQSERNIHSFRNLRNNSITNSSSNNNTNNNNNSSRRNRPRRSRTNSSGGMWLRNTATVTKDGTVEKVDRPRRIKQNSITVAFLNRK